MNPATGEIVASFQSLTDAEIEQRLEVAHRAALSWRIAPIAERVAVLRRAAELLEERKLEYGRLMTLEMGKTLRSAVEEAVKCASGCRYYAENAERFLADQPVESDKERGWISFQPIGVVLAVMPWNFPFWQVVRFAAPAIAAGNVGLLKHASNVPQCALALEQLFIDAGAPGGVFQTLLIGSDPIARIIADDRVAAATLTGSEGAGSSVAAAAGKAIKKTVLELGGSDPFVVMPSADLDAAVTTAVTARTINNGQSCIAAKRFIVADSIFDDFVKQFVDKVKHLVVGNPMEEKTQIGPLASKQIRDDLDDQVKRAVAGGARVLTGGKPIDGSGFYYEPTVLDNVSTDSPVFREETFGPLAAVIRARDIDHAIELANDSRFGLGSAAWTRDEAEIQRFARDLAAARCSSTAWWPQIRASRSAA
jgi:succinate-semialdehyde dehydrogenase/glutarate-semialdehyde dehydrogenase